VNADLEPQWSDCKERDATWKEKIIESYKDANEIVNYENFAEDVDFNSAAALEFLGPSGLNKDQQGQINAVLANIATMKEGASWWTPNWIRVRHENPGCSLGPF
jgi:hypothetical protein